MSRHKSIPEKTRRAVYEKYGGRCAYCGCEIEYKDMQADHIKSVYLHADRKHDMTEEELNGLDNLMPACRMCNFYKASGDTEYLRSRLEGELIRNLRRPFGYRMALKYSLIREDIHPIKFYFEEIQEEN